MKYIKSLVTISMLQILMYWAFSIPVYYFIDGGPLLLSTFWREVLPYIVLPMSVLLMFTFFREGLDKK